MMNDRELKTLMKAIDVPTVPPTGLKELLLAKVVAPLHETAHGLSAVERFVFEKPLRVASIASVVVSGALWAIFGSGFPALMNGLIG